MSQVAVSIVSMSVLVRIPVPPRAPSVLWRQLSLFDGAWLSVCTGGPEADHTETLFVSPGIVPSSCRSGALDHPDSSLGRLP
jgi:hypothetical protein